MTDRKLRILVLTTSYPNFPGHGSGAFVHEQARGLVELGHEVRVICPAAPGLRLNEEIDGVAVSRFRYAPEAWQQVAYGGGIPANLAQKPSRRLLVPSFLLSFLKTTREEAPQADILHAHWTAAGLVARFGRKGRPVVQSFHGSDLMGKSAAMRRLSAFAAETAAAVLIHASEMRRRALEAGIDEKKILLVPHGVDCEKILPAAPASPPEILFVGRLSEEKGPDLLLRAFSLVKDRNTRLVFIGDGPMRGALASSAKELGIEDRVEWAGELPHDETIRRISRAFVFVVPSRREGFGVACLEAMAAGRPIVATRCGGPEDLIRDGETGLLVPVEDAPGIAKAVERLLADEPERQRVGRAARARAVESYDRRTIIRRLEKIYLDVCAVR